MEQCCNFLKTHVHHRLKLKLCVIQCFISLRDQSHDSRSQDTEGMLTQMQEVYLQSTFDEVITKHHFSSHEVLEVVRNLLIASSSV